MSFKMAANKPSPVGKGGITDPGILQPIVFANSQRLFKVLSALFSAGLFYYMVFKADFGEKRHCFSWIRDKKKQKERQFFYISPDDKLILEQQRQKLTSSTDNSSSGNE